MRTCAGGHQGPRRADVRGPLPGAFTKPVASARLDSLLAARGSPWSRCAAAGSS